MLHPEFKGHADAHQRKEVPRLVQRGDALPVVVVHEGKARSVGLGLGRNGAEEPGEHGALGERGGGGSVGDLRGQSGQAEETERDGGGEEGEGGREGGRQGVIYMYMCNM